MPQTVNIRNPQKHQYILLLRKSTARNLTTESSHGSPTASLDPFSNTQDTAKISSVELIQLPNILKII
ncbi:hypothetical protein E2C01_020867 [Portunus trituberculatus]|uniref:Uncharacterized protein n=1 Tax=Portunus trituberculatus TaxID=210409 RepID=A0A5B7E1Q8_PORTR|nr:hypothetical protein [Portunus trituberculatus]